MSQRYEGWEPVIGLEVHCQLRTESKLFSSAPNHFGAEPNHHTTEVDLGMPGVLPVINGHAVELALRVALALGCKVHPVSIFARKHYFYPDLPKGYQISQYEEPYSTEGAVPVELDGEEFLVPLTRIHMEEDAGKLVHDSAITGGAASYVDLNRAGVPLIEIVSEPAMHTPEVAAAYLRSLHSIVRYVGASDADMEKGNFRCDANVSVRHAGTETLGTRTELKNLNSFRFVEKAIAYEIERHIDVIEGGGEIVQETRLWDDKTGQSRSMRGKENAHDYRYFPEPDLIPLRLGEDLIVSQRDKLPALPHERRKCYREEWGLAVQDATTLAEDRGIAEYFEATVVESELPKLAANWVKQTVLRTLTDTGSSIEELKATPRHLAALLKLVDGGQLTVANGRDVFAEMVETGEDAATIMQAKGLESVSDTGELETMAREVLDANADQLEKFRAGEEKIFNWFVGQIMKKTRGKANPAAVQQVLKKLLAI